MQVTQGHKYATICLNMSEFTTVDMVPSMSRIVHSCEVTLRVSQYLLKDWRIQNPFKDLRSSALENNYSF